MERQDMTYFWKQARHEHDNLLDRLVHGKRPSPLVHHRGTGPVLTPGETFNKAFRS